MFFIFLPFWKSKLFERIVSEWLFAKEAFIVDFFSDSIILDPFIHETGLFEKKATRFFQQLKSFKQFQKKSA